jgi:hypothetical protein
MTVGTYGPGTWDPGTPSPGPGSQPAAPRARGCSHGSIKASFVHQSGAVLCSAVCTALHCTTAGPCVVSPEDSFPITAVIYRYISRQNTHKEYTQGVHTLNTIMEYTQGIKTVNTITEYRLNAYKEHILYHSSSSGS